MCFFSCCKGIWCLLPATQPGQVQPYLPRTALVRGQVVKIWAMCLLGQCGWGKEGLTLSLYSSTRDALLCDVVKVIQESWYEVLEGWFQCWCHAKLWSYFQGVRILPSLLFWGKGTGPIPSLETVTNIIMNISPGIESMSTKQSWLRRPPASVLKVNCLLSSKSPIDIFTLQMWRWLWGEKRDIGRR